MMRQEGIIEDHTDWVRSVALRKDNNFIVSGSDENTVRLWDLNAKCQEKNTRMAN